MTVLNCFSVGGVGWTGIESALLCSLSGCRDTPVSFAASTICFRSLPSCVLYFQEKGPSSGKMEASTEKKITGIMGSSSHRGLKWEEDCTSLIKLKGSSGGSIRSKMEQVIT